MAAYARRCMSRLVTSRSFASRRVTEEGIVIHQDSPYRDSMHLVWGNILWDAGVALSKYFAWRGQEQEGCWRGRRVLELGAGTGVVGLTLGKLGASVTMTDNEPEVLSLLRRNAAANGLGALAEDVRELNWSDPSTFVKPAVPFDAIVAADVLYSKKDRKIVAFVACPPREDSPLGGFFEKSSDLGLQVERLEDCKGCAVASIEGAAANVYRGSRFNVLNQDRFDAAAADAKKHIQVFRLTWSSEGSCKHNEAGHGSA
eukprot:gb/GFBE01049320.1/.p1 GENE.gb/GFBE01049320.1/~~gb/GFBE01049320.1/.p1  ORF type:complete len:258 (+),score=39.22 gb/GFBE01049320.1/:1-774(+)